MSKRTPEEILDALDDEEADDEMDRVLAMSGDERRREIEAAGADVDALHDRADKAHGEIGNAAFAPAGRPLRAVRPRREARIVLLLAAAFGALVVTGIERRELVALFEHKPAPIKPELQEPQKPPKPPTPQERAEALRNEAFDSCGEWLWAECDRKLDEAKQLDPGGESDLRVQGARKEVRDGLHPDEGWKRGPK
jgi:hypothetical protein